MRHGIRYAFGVAALASMLGCGGGGGATTTTTTEPAPPETVALVCAPDFGTEAGAGTRFEDVSPESAIAWPTPGVRFAMAVTRHGDGVRVEATLTNTTDGEVSVDYLTGGVVGLSTNPLDVTIEGEDRVATGPEIYPAPRRATLPARATLTFRVDRCPPYPARIRATFTPWKGPAETSEVTLR